MNLLDFARKCHLYKATYLVVVLISLWNLEIKGQRVKCNQNICQTWASSNIPLMEARSQILKMFLTEYIVNTSLNSRIW
jgi:hypothetical protein